MPFRRRAQPVEWQIIERKYPVQAKLIRCCSMAERKKQLHETAQSSGFTIARDLLRRRSRRALESA